MFRNLALIFIFFAQSTFAVVDKTSFDHGEYIEVFGHKKLTPLWSQEYIGSDLVQEELMDLSTGNIDIAIFDLGFEEDHVTLDQPIDVPPQMNRNRRMRANHGTSVASVINGPAPYGNSQKINLMNLSAIPYSFFYSSVWNNFEKENRYPKIISNSLGWTGDSPAKVAQKAHEKNILWFLASGNSWPEPVRQNEIESKALLVGSFAPNGLTSFGTQLHNDMLILAPSNGELLAIDGYGKRTLFGGTSGATPVVAATMANIASLWPQIGREETKKLLLNTSFPSAENKLGNLNSPRHLNAYKAFKVAQRILSFCRNGQKVKDCFNSSLDSASFYYFSFNLITCEEFKNTHRDFQMDLLKKMRRRALLNTAHQDDHLSCAYDHLGFSANAEYYRFRSQSSMDMNDYLEETKDALNLGVFEISLYKYFSKMNKEELRETMKNSTEISDFRKEQLYKLMEVSIN